ncbi:MAG: DUF4149 domain-containing protein [Planctomycetota bacterium]
MTQLQEQRRPARQWRKTGLAALLAIWLGGLVFYATLVIPTGADVLGGHTAFGFITRRVTVKLNLLGSGVLVVLLIERWQRGARSGRRGLAIAWWIMATCQTALFFLHPWLDQLLDAEARRILDPDAFYRRHQIYLWTAMVQWLAGAFTFHRVVTRG